MNTENNNMIDKTKEQGNFIRALSSKLCNKVVNLCLGTTSISIKKFYAPETVISSLILPKVLRFYVLCTILLTPRKNLSISL